MERKVFKFWGNLIDFLNENNIKYQTYNDEHFCLVDHDNITQIVLKFDELQLSIISHKYSYGGIYGLYEVMTTCQDVTGYLNIEELKKIIIDYINENK